MSANDMNFLSDLIPAVVIKVVTIETAGGLVELETNPHIVEDNVPVYKRAELQRTIGAEGGAELERLMATHRASLSTTSLTGMTRVAGEHGIGTDDSETTIVTIDCAITDTLSRTNPASQWFASGDITKYLFIYGVQFASKKAVSAYESLLSSATGPVMQIVHSYLQGSMSATELRNQAHRYSIRNVGNIISAKDDISWDLISVQDIINSIDSSTTGEAVTEQDLMLAGLSSTDTRGNTVYEFPAKFQFETKSAEPSHLAYYVVPFLHVENLLEDNNLTTTSTNMTAAQYSNNGQWITAISDGKLNRNDTRISDFRNVDTVVPAHSVDLSLINQLDELASGTAQNFTTLPSYRHKYFSDIHLSFTTSRECGFAFAFNQLDFMKDNSVYGRLFDNVEDSLADIVLSKCAIEEVKIIRRRVRRHKQGAYARGYPNTYEPWDATQVDHVVVSSKAAKKDKRLQATQRLEKLGTATVSIGGVREVHLQTNVTNGKDFRVRHFTGKDAEIKNHTTGEYQYGVEITMRDYVPVYIGDRLERLRQHVSRLKEYEVFANIPLVNRYVQTYSEPHVSSKRVDQTSKKAIPVVDIFGGTTKKHSHGNSTATQEGFYDPTINRFTSEFNEFALRRYATTRPWERAANAFVDVLDLIINSNLSVTSKSQLAEDITAVCNPVSGSPRGIATVISMLDKYIKIVEDLISAEPTTTNSSAASNPSTPHGGTGVTDRTVTYKTYFNNDSFDADAPPKTGVTFMKVTSAGDVATLPMVSTSAYKKRASEEVLKFFVSPTAAPKPDAAYKCLSAQSMNLLESDNTINLESVNNTDDVLHQIEMGQIFQKIVQYMGSVRKAGQTRTLTIDSKQRIGQALAPEFGFSLMTATEYDNAIKEGTQTQLMAPDVDQGSSAEVGFEAKISPISIPFTTAEDEEVDYLNVFPSAMATEDWLLQQSTSEMVEVFNNLAAGFEAMHESSFLIQMFINTTRDLMHSTPHHPARPNEANFSVLGVIGWVLTQAMATGATTYEDLDRAYRDVLDALPISMQAAAVSVGPSDSVHSNIADRINIRYWNNPVYNILYQLHFMMTARVEYLAGYGNSNLTPRYTTTIGAETWKPLTKDRVDALSRQEGQIILCRIRPYNFEALRIAYPKALKMPIWNSRFLLVGNNDKPLSGIKKRIGITAPKKQLVRQGLKY